MVKYPSDDLYDYESICFEYECDFVEHFWKCGYELASVSFSSTHVKVVIVTHEGQHICDSISVSSFKEWLAVFCWYKED